MGLDVSVYTNLVSLDVVFDSDGCPIDPITRCRIDDYFRPYSNPDFPGRCSDLNSDAVYGYDEYLFVWSSGYGYYNAWREKLAQLAGYPSVSYEVIPGYSPSRRSSFTSGAGEVGSGPFYELIWFSDCQGTIGSDVSLKLFNDFVCFEQNAKTFGDKFYSEYCDWMNAFKIASNNGAISFH